MNMKENNPFVVSIMGPQGAGKGTQAELLAKHFHLKVIEIGKELRKIAETETPLGRKIDNLINKQGKMVPVDLVMKVVRCGLKRISKKQGIIFDGTPRRISEIKPLEKELKKIGRTLDLIIYLKLSQKEAIKRLGKRRMCLSCGALYIDGVTLKKGAKICPKCGGKIIKRPDDRSKAIRERFRLYKEKTKPVLDYYRKRNRLIEIDGSQSIENVFQAILKKLSADFL